MNAANYPHKGGSGKGKPAALNSTVTCQKRFFLGMFVNYRYDLDNEMWFGGGLPSKILYPFRIFPLTLASHLKSWSIAAFVLEVHLVSDNISSESRATPGGFVPEPPFQAEHSLEGLNLAVLLG